MRKFSPRRLQSFDIKLSRAVLRVFIAAFLFLFVSIQLAPPAEAGRGRRRRRAVLPVEVQKAAKARMGRGVKATGTIYPFSEVKLMSRAEGQVQEVKVREGDFLLKGQILATLDSTIHRIQLALAESELASVRAHVKKLKAGYRPQEIAAAEAGVEQVRASLKRSEAELEGAKARLKEAEINAQSLEAMFKRGVISRQEWLKVSTESLRARAEIAERTARISEDRARINVASEELKLKRLGNRAEDIEAAKADEQKARQNVFLLQTQLDYFNIKSPISGVVTERRVEPGDLAVNRSHLFTLAQIRKLRVRSRVSELDLTRLKKGQNTRIELDAFRGRIFNGKLSRIYPQVDPRARQLTVEVELDNSNLVLRPGLLARLKFEPLMGREVINLPVHAVLWDGNTERRVGHVFVIKRMNGKRRGKEGKGGRGGQLRKKGDKRPDAVSGQAEAGEKKIGAPRGGKRGGKGGGKKGPKFMAVKRKVKLGEMVDGRIEILKGLKVGERVIVSATGQLKDGKPIRIVN
ncbi:MAG: efflux RND transporter periplasmic adaptor subunit [Nitrospinaceae bacterium]|nr:efflux RND transporter periplasmic adaptor subunit [Nitrospinaceae bacterium]MBT4431451.1 efflux RND transporter periplasmic adaptor subunit [Nitrospinaceae bacterium]